jgi:TnsA endonuclease N terminal
VRRIPLSRRSHVTGFHGLPTGAVDYESALERDFVLLTRFDDPAVRIRSQPITLHFEYEGRQRRYTPDYLVEGGGRFELVEIKYEADLQRLAAQLQPGFDAARGWAAQSSMQDRSNCLFCIWRRCVERYAPIRTLHSLRGTNSEQATAQPLNRMEFTCDRHGGLAIVPSFATRRAAPTG